QRGTGLFVPLPYLRRRAVGFSLAATADCLYEVRFVTSRRGLNGGLCVSSNERAAGSSTSVLPCSRLRTIRFEPFPGSKGSAWDAAVDLERHEMALYEHIFLARQDVTA